MPPPPLDTCVKRKWVAWPALRTYNARSGRMCSISAFFLATSSLPVRSGGRYPGYFHKIDAGQSKTRFQWSCIFPKTPPGCLGSLLEAVAICQRTLDSISKKKCSDLLGLLLGPPPWKALWPKVEGKENKKFHGHWLLHSLKTGFHWVV